MECVWRELGVCDDIDTRGKINQGRSSIENTCCGYHNTACRDPGENWFYVTGIQVFQTQVPRINFREIGIARANLSVYLPPLQGTHNFADPNRRSTPTFINSKIITYLPSINRLVVSPERAWLACNRWSSCRWLIGSIATDALYVYRGGNSSSFLHKETEKCRNTSFCHRPKEVPTSRWNIITLRGKRKKFTSPFEYIIADSWWNILFF